MTVEALQDNGFASLETDEEPSGPRPRVLMSTPEAARARPAPANDLPWLRPIVARDGSFRC